MRLWKLRLINCLASVHKEKIVSLITGITARITEWPTEGKTAQAVREDAVKRGVLPPEQAPNVPTEEPTEAPDDAEQRR